VVCVQDAVKDEKEEENKKDKGKEKDHRRRLVKLGLVVVLQRAEYNTNRIRLFCRLEASSRCGIWGY